MVINQSIPPIEFDIYYAYMQYFLKEYKLELTMHGLDFIFNYMQRIWDMRRATEWRFTSCLLLWLRLPFYSIFFIPFKNVI